ncbi:hypothetical protein [Microbacterium plantarum]|uniref:hypothetical protein n=1 Tax=Microbacterium plantarum TaxID=1816425 RepID=UPI002B49272E|nr:hypothetical protein [Microbacterium plantarum]WRK16099.1 hypothetical protein VC184_09215 [Microbacterium plantarum]
MARLSPVKRVWSTAVVAVVLILSGCGAQGDAGESTATSPSASPTADLSALDDLRESYVAAGGQCATMTARETAVAEDAGDCDGGALLTTYRSESQRDIAIDTLEALQESNPRPHVIAVGPDWIVNGTDAESRAEATGGAVVQIGRPAASAPAFDLATDEGLCAADADMTNLELNDALAPLLGYPAHRDARTSDQDDAIREYKNAAFERACPARAG